MLKSDVTNFLEHVNVFFIILRGMVRLILRSMCEVLQTGSKNEEKCQEYAANLHLTVIPMSVTNAR